MWKNSWLFVVKICTSVNFFRIFGANVFLVKNTLKTRKRLLLDDYISKQGIVPKFLPYRSYYVCHKLFLAEFLCSLERLEQFIWRRRKTRFSQKRPFSNSCSSVTTWQNWIFKKSFESLPLNGFIFKIRFLAYL